MVARPNRSKKAAGQGRNPSGEEIRAARLQASLTQRDAADLVYASLRAWEDWEAGRSRMHPATWELFCIKAGVKS